MNLRKYKNEGNMNINYIRYAQEVFPHCEIGKENYKGKIKVYMEPGEYIMDYCDEYQFIKETYNDNSWSGEVLVNHYFNHLVEQYGPKHLQVVLFATTSGHFPVEISKEK